MNVLSRYKSIQRGTISIGSFLKETKGETQVLIDEHFKEENKIKAFLFGCLKVRAWTQRIWRTNIKPDLDYSELKQSFSPLLLWILKNKISRIWIGFGDRWRNESWFPFINRYYLSWETLGSKEICDWVLDALSHGLASPLRNRSMPR